jgi:hypothetical protein
MQYIFCYGIYFLYLRNRTLPCMFRYLHPYRAGEANFSRWPFNALCILAFLCVHYFELLRIRLS